MYSGGVICDKGDEYVGVESLLTSCSEVQHFF